MKTPKLKFIFIFGLIFLVRTIVQSQPVQRTIYNPKDYPNITLYSVCTPVINNNSIPTHLLMWIESIDISATISPFYIGEIGITFPPYYPQIQWYDQWYPELFVIPTFGVWNFSVLTCGETYHENGQLKSKVECIDSVFHGKAFWWDETGHKTNESTYHEGHLIKSKNYDTRGRVNTVYHYDYSGQLHGVCITYNYYDTPNKRVERYHHGNLHGIQEEFQDGKLIERNVYDQNLLLKRENFTEGVLRNLQIYSPSGLIEEKRYYTNGSLSYHYSKNVNTGIEFYKEWNQEGTVTLDKNYISGQPVGEWLLYFDSSSGLKEREFYENGVIVKRERTKFDQLIERTTYKENNKNTYLKLNDNSDTTYFATYDNGGRLLSEKSWNEKNVPLTNLLLGYDATGYPLLQERGFYSVRDTLFYYEIEDEPWQLLEKRWVVYNGDTLRQDYIANYSGISGNLILLYSNRYSQGHNITVKQGQWRYYSKNNLDSVITYVSGERSGLAIYYSSEHDSVYVTSSGSYSSNLRHGKWSETYNAIASTEEIEYVSQLGLSKVDSLVTTYSVGKREGECQGFSADGKIIFSGNYQNDIKIGWWYFYDKSGNIVEKINFKKGTVPKKLAEYFV